VRVQHLAKRELCQRSIRDSSHKSSPVENNIANRTDAFADRDYSKQKTSTCPRIAMYRCKRKKDF